MAASFQKRGVGREGEGRGRVGREGSSVSCHVETR